MKTIPPNPKGLDEAGKAAAEVMAKPKPIDPLTDEDRAMIAEMKKRGNHAYDEDKIPPVMVNLERLGKVTRRDMGARKIFCLAKG